MSEGIMSWGIVSVPRWW